MTRFQYFHTLRRTWPIAFLAALVLLILVPIFTLTVITNPETDWLTIFKNALPFFFLLLLWLFLLGVLPRRNARKQLAAQSYLREPITYLFTCEAITGTGPSARWSIAWNVLKRVRETKSLFVFYHGPNIGVIAPKRFFQSSSEMEKWRQLVVTYLDTKRIEKPGFVGRLC